MTGQNNSRETADDYAGEIFRANGYRIVVCRNGIQWVVQRLTRASGGPRTTSWRALAYAQTREGVERLWAAKTATLPPPEVLALHSLIKKRQKPQKRDVKNAH